MLCSLSPSTHVTFSLFINSPLTSKYKYLSKLKKRPGRKDFQRAIVSGNEINELIVDTTGIQGSHMLRAMSKANCFIILSAESGDVEANLLVEVPVMLFMVKIVNNSRGWYEHQS